MDRNNRYELSETEEAGWSVVVNIVSEGAKTHATNKAFPDPVLGTLGRALGPAATTVMEGTEIADALRKGDYQDAAKDSVGLGGALAGGWKVGIVGATIGGQLTAGHPVGIVTGAANGGAAGAILGEEILEGVFDHVVDGARRNSATVSSRDFGTPYDGNMAIRSETTWSGRLENGTLARTTHGIDPKTGEFVPVTTTVLSTNGPTGTRSDLLRGNTYAPDAVEVGYELNGLDQFAHESHVLGRHGSTMAPSPASPRTPGRVHTGQPAVLAPTTSTTRATPADRRAQAAGTSAAGNPVRRLNLREIPIRGRRAAVSEAKTTVPVAARRAETRARRGAVPLATEPVVVRAQTAGVATLPTRGSPARIPSSSTWTMMASRSPNSRSRHRSSTWALMRVAHARSVHGDIPFSDAKVDRAFDKTVDASGQHLGLVVTLGERVRGSCYCSLGGYFIGEGGRIVSVTTFNIDPGCGGSLLGGKVALRLVKGIEVWARSREATHVLYHVTAGVETARADRFFRRIGMKQLGGNYGVRFLR